MATLAHQDVEDARQRLALGDSLMEAAAELGCTRAELDLALWKGTGAEPEEPAVAASVRRRARCSRWRQENVDERRSLASLRRDWRC